LGTLFSGLGSAHGLRMLSQEAHITAIVAVLTLALGVGSQTRIFSIRNGPCLAAFSAPTAIRSLWYRIFFNEPGARIAGR